MSSRRDFLAAAAAGTTALWARGAVAAVPATLAQEATAQDAAAAGADGLVLSVQPGRVFKRSSDRNALRTEYWLFNLLLQSPAQDGPAIESLVVTCRSGEAVRRTTTWTTSEAARANLLAAAPMRAPEGGWLVAAFRIADAMPAELAVDRVRKLPRPVDTR